MREVDSSDRPGGHNEYRIGLWAPGRWLVAVKAFDDTSSLAAPAPEEVLEAIYYAGKEMELFL